MPERAHTLKVDFARPEDLHHFFYQQLQRDSLLLDTRHKLPEATPVTVLLSVTGCSGNLRLQGHVAPPREQDGGAVLRVHLEDPEGAISSVASFIALVDSLLLVTAPPPDERRWSARINASVPVWLRFQGSDQFRDYYTQDLSRTGIFVFAHDVRPTGTLVEVLLVPPGPERGFVLQGAVTRAIHPHEDPRRRPGMGVHFTDVPRQGTLEIERYLRAVVGFDTPLSDLEEPDGMSPNIELDFPLAEDGAVPAPTTRPQRPVPAPAARSDLRALPDLRSPHPDPSPPREADSAQAALPDLTQARPRQGAPAGTPAPSPGEHPGKPAPNDRRLARIQARLRVLIRPANLGRFRELYTQNLSRGGLFVQTNRPVASGTEVEVVIAVPGTKERLTFEGEVAHAAVGGEGDSGMGIRLARLSPEARATIERMLERLVGLSSGRAPASADPRPRRPQISIASGTAPEAPEPPQDEDPEQGAP